MVNSNVEWKVAWCFCIEDNRTVKKEIKFPTQYILRNRISMPPLSPQQWPSNQLAIKYSWPKWTRVESSN